MHVDTISDETTACGARTIAELLGAAASAYKDGPALRFKRDGQWQDVSYVELQRASSEVSRGLLALGVEAGDKVGLLCSTRYEWMYADYGITQTGAVVVPVYPTSSASECAWVLGNSESKVVFCENAEQVAKIMEVRDQLPDLQTIISIDACDEHGVVSFEELGERGSGVPEDELERRIADVSVNDVYTIIYTSGTTGPPKGSVLTHGNYLAVMRMAAPLLPEAKGDSVYLYLPLAHSFALLVQLVTLDQGGVIAFWTGDINLIIPEAMEIKPGFFPSVPRLFEKLYRLVQANVDAETLHRATDVGGQVRRHSAKGETISPELQQEFDRFEEMLFQNVRNALGGRIQWLVTGGAPIAPEIIEFFDAAGIPMLEAYGLTETSTVLSGNTPEHNKLGTAGKPLAGVEVKIADDGEVLVKGANVFQGYYKVEADEEGYGAIREGWFHTGDLGELDDEGYLKITGRKKDIIITAGGKNITPANIENDLTQSRWISQAVMYGDRRPYPVAVIALDPEQIMVFAKENNLPEDLPTLAKHPKIIELIQGIIDETNANHVRPAQIKRFTIIDHELSYETGELTPTFKVKRNVVHEKYRDLFEGLYA